MQVSEYVFRVCPLARGHVMTAQLVPGIQCQHKRSSDGKLGLQRP